MEGLMEGLMEGPMPGLMPGFPARPAFLRAAPRAVSRVFAATDAPFISSLLPP
jgi:hypothetical protein